MTPLYFGTRQRRLFGLYTPALAGPRPRAVVLCNPFGQEYLRAHRTLRQLGQQLAGAGCHTLRFDYHGTGDSAGDMAQADVAGWQDDIGAAIDELRDTCDLPRVTLVGLRLGALLAARVAAARPRDVEALVLWDPLLSGAAYVEALLDDSTPREERYQRPVRRPAERGGGHEVVGFVVTEGLARELAALELAASVPGLPARTLLLCTEAAAATGAQALPPRRDGTPLAPLLVEDEPAWGGHGDGPGALPVKAVQGLVDWVAK